MTHIIKNFDTLATTPERVDALAIAEAGYAGVHTHEAILRKVRMSGTDLLIEDTSYPLKGRRVFFVGVGKCAFTGGKALEEILGDHLTAGIALDVSDIEKSGLTKIEAYAGTHPEPSDINIRATERITAFLSQCRAEDLVIMLVSGGGSTLLCLPDAPMTFVDEKALFNALTSRGASIQELNTVRKHISKARGGGLAQAAYPAEVVALVISDVPDNNIAYISSGPTVRDMSTVEDAKAILTRYEVPTPSTTMFIETPKEEKYFERVTNTLLVSNRDALEAMRSEAERLGYATTIVNNCFTGEAQEIGRTVTAALHSALAKSALLYAGESTVTLGEQYGQGGRNQEMALAIVKELAEDELVLPFASDGHDNSDHAGAIADGTTRVHAEEKDLAVDEALSAHESYNFFITSGDALKTGYTGSNVSDLIIAIKK